MLTKVFCSRASRSPHLLGTITAEPAGVMLNYRSAVHTASTDRCAVQCSDGFWYLNDGADATYGLSPNENTQIDVWCRSCRTGHPVESLALFRAAERRSKAVTLNSRGAWEGLFQ